MPTPLRVLLIEDSDDDAELLLHELRRGGYAPDWQRVDTALDLRAALAARNWDLITCDYVMPQFSAPAALSLIRASGLDLPVIIVSGQVGEEVAVTAMKAGAHDYVSKHRMTRLVPAIERELADAASRRARREAEATLRASEDKYRQLVEALHEVIFEVDADGRITYLSPAVEAVSGYTAADLVGRPFAEFVHRDDRDRSQDAMRGASRGLTRPDEVRIIDRSGKVRWARTSSRPIFEDGALVAVRGVLADITERKEAEDAYRAVFEQSVLGLAVAQDGRMVLANAALAALSGRDPDQLIGQPVTALTLEMVHPDDRERMLAAARSFSAGGPPTGGHDFRVVRLDGAVRHVLTTQREFHYRGAPARLITYMDVTDRWRAETTYRSIFENSLEALVVVQGDRYAMVNPAFAAVFGVARDELFDRSLAEMHARFIHPDDQHTVAGLTTNWLERGEVGPPFEYRLIRGDGAVRQISCRSVGIVFEGAPAVLSAVCDLTDQRRAEQIYRAVFEHSPEGLAVIQQGRPVVVNPAHAALLGVPVDTVASLTLDEICERFVHRDDRARFRRYHDEWTGKGIIPEPYEMRFTRADGEERQARCQATAIEFDGQPAALIALTDLTDRRRAEEAYRSVFEHSLQGLTVVCDDHIVMANQGIVDLTGYAMDELVGVHAHVLMERMLHPDDRAALFASLQDHRAHGTISRERREFRMVRKDGAVIHVLAQSSLITFGGKPAMLVAHVDLTDRWLAETALRDLNLQLEARVAERTADLEAAARELETFSYSVSHDLRAPLRAIDGYTQGVLAEHGAALPAAARADLERVRGATHRMGDLIDQLLGLSQVMRRELRRGPVDLSGLAREVAQELAGGDPARAVAVCIADGLRAEGDAPLLRAVLANLLANAWKFTRPRAAARVEVGAVADTPGAFYVRDNGVGFDMRDAERLFQAFQRLHPTSEFDGNGIGLATVARIVTRHGGRVWAHASVGEGATFCFSLPTSS